MGPEAVPFIEPLLTHENPEIAFAAARAGAFLSNVGSETALMNMATSSSHPFQLAAVQTLSKLPSSPVINQMLRSLLDADQTLVRIEAYRALAENGDRSIVTRQIPQADPHQGFFLDLVPSVGPPIAYASRTGVPRIAVIGERTKVDLPMLFTANDRQLMISSDSDRQLINVYYRGKEVTQPISMTSSPDLAELIGRLGGEGAPGETRLHFNYCDIVSVVQAMSDQQKLSATGPGKTRRPVSFILQEAPSAEQTIEDAPMIPDEPTTQPAEQTGQVATGSGTNR
jgi:hypothetical protein